MSCACKAVRNNKDKKYKNANGTIKSLGFMYYIDFLFRKIILNRVFMPFLMLVLCIILFPLIIIVLIVTQIITGEAKIVLPKKILSHGE